MFHIVRFDSDAAREKKVVPSIWLNKNDALCILPPVTTAAEIESLAQLSAQPTDGWRMYGVSSLKTFDTYEQAKESLERMNREAASEPSEFDDVVYKRQKRRPSHLNEYVEGSDEDYEEQSETLNSSSSSGEIATNTDPLIVKVEPLPNPRNSGKYPMVRLCDFVPFFEQNNNNNRQLTSKRRRSAAEDSQLQVSNLSDIDVTCPCNSACHRLILHTLRRIQREVETNTRLLQQLLGQQPVAKPAEVRSPHRLPKDFPVTLPTTDIKDVEKLDVYLQDDSNFAKTLPYFTQVGGNDSKQNLKRLMETLISVELAPQLNWKGRGAKKPFSAYTRIHSLIFNAVKQNPKSGATTLSDIEKNIKDWLRFAPDRQGDRRKRKLELEEKVLKC